MPKYLWQVSYTAEGARGLALEGGTRRRETIDAMFQEAGGSMEAFYYAFGSHDLIVIGDLPDNATAAAIALRTAGSGSARSRTTVLLAPEELDQAAQQNVEYRPSGA
jgi:uncharacterized protein with GYD domain